MMDQKRAPVLLCVAIWILLAFVWPAELRAAPMKKVRAAFTSFSYAQPPFWIAKELKLFDKYGLDAELIYISGAKAIAALLGGSIDVAQVSAAATLSAASRGADLAILGSNFTRLVFFIHAVPQIKEVADLRGKVLGMGSFGSNPHLAALVLLSKMGLVPNKDVGLVAVAGGDPAILAALQQGKIQAGLLTPPTTTMAERLGFREIFDIASLNFPFPIASTVSTRRFIAANPDTTLNILRSSAEAIYLYRTRPDLTLPAVAKYVRVSRDDPSLIQSHQLYGKHFNQTLAPPLDGIKFILDFIAEQTPSVKGKQPADFIDLSFVKKLEEEGFFRRLSGP